MKRGTFCNGVPNLQVPGIVEADNIARKCLIERLLVETDAPWLAPVPMRGHRNEPAFVVHTARCVAETRREDFGQFAQQTTQNASDLFGLVLPTSETS